jgi:hypothetical protein
MMKVEFSGNDRDKILGDIKAAMGGRQLAEMVNFELGSKGLIVTISKMGTSTLQFDESPSGDGLTYNLSKEKIAFTHKPFKDEVTAKILNVIEKAGGKVSR